MVFDDLGNVSHQLVHPQRWVEDLINTIHESPKSHRRKPTVCIKGKIADKETEPVELRLMFASTLLVPGRIVREILPIGIFGSAIAALVGVLTNTQRPCCLPLKANVVEVSAALRAFNMVASRLPSTHLFAAQRAIFVLKIHEVPDGVNDAQSLHLHRIAFRNESGVVECDTLAFGKFLLDFLSLKRHSFKNGHRRGYI